MKINRDYHNLVKITVINFLKFGGCGSGHIRSQ